MSARTRAWRSDSDRIIIQHRRVHRWRRVDRERGTHPHCVAFGEYSGTYEATGRSMRAAFAHHYTLRKGKIARMVQYVDSYVVRQALMQG